MQFEIKPIKELFIWLIPVTLVNIQSHFSGWYNWVRILNVGYRNCHIVIT